MKCVYKVNKLEAKVFLTSGKTIICNGHRGRCCYTYGEMPENKYEEFIDNAWEKIIEFIGYKNGYYGEKTMFRKRSYLHHYCITNEPIYQDEVCKFTIKTIYEEVENPIIKYLQQDLGFKGYSELVFDREQELKNLIMY